jgi:hypothetical protein
VVGINETEGRERCALLCSILPARRYHRVRGRDSGSYVLSCLVLVLDQNRQARRRTRTWGRCLIMNPTLINVNVVLSCPWLPMLLLHKKSM